MKTGHPDDVGKPGQRTFLTGWQAYRKMTWTSDADECEAACGKIMAEGFYKEGSFGHYCSCTCRDVCESGPDVDYRSDERKQMGITS